MIAIATQLLTLALSLLLAAQGANVPDAQRTQAIAVANSAIQIATQTIQNYRVQPAATSIPPAATSPVATTTLPVVVTSTSTASTTPPVPVGPPSLTITLNPDYKTINISPGSPNQDIADFIVTAGRAEAVNISSTTLSFPNPLAFQNPKILVNRTFWAGSATTTPQSQVIIGNTWPITVPAGQSVRLDVLADTVATTTGISSAVTLQGCVAAGATSGTPVGCAGISGQGITAGPPAMTVLQDAAHPNLGAFGGAAGQWIGSFLLSSSVSEPLQVQGLSLTLGQTGGALSDLKITVNDTQFGPILPSLTAGGFYQVTGTPFNVPLGSTSTVVKVYADASPAVQNMNPAVSLTGCSGVGTISGTYFTCSGGASGQPVTASTTPQ